MEEWAYALFWEATGSELPFLQAIKQEGRAWPCPFIGDTIVTVGLVEQQESTLADKPPM